MKNPREEREKKDWVKGHRVEERNPQGGQQDEEESSRLADSAVAGHRRRESPDTRFRVVQEKKEKEVAKKKT